MDVSQETTAASITTSNSNNGKRGMTDRTREFNELVAAAGGLPSAQRSTERAHRSATAALFAESMALVSRDLDEVSRAVASFTDRLFPARGVPSAHRAPHAVAARRRLADQVAV